MKVLTLLICISLYYTNAKAQEKLLTFYTSNWKDFSKNKGEYIREIQVINDSVYFINDYLIKGRKLIMSGYFKSINPFIENGPIEYFDESGNQIMKGKYNNGEQIGIWSLKDYFQIANAELDYNFKLIYQNDSANIKISHKDSVAVNEILTETHPEFPGGGQALLNYLRHYHAYPYKCILMEEDLKAIVGFKISKTGFVINPVIIKSSGVKAYDKEVIRMIKDMPKWKPGTQNNQPVDVRYTLPMSFSFSFK